MYRRSPESLEALLNKGVVWRGRDRDMSRVRAMSAVSTGLNTLDHHLHGGWPSHTSIELCVPAFAVEWYLLTEQLSRVTRSGKIAVLVNPPHTLMASKLLADGVCLPQLWIVETRGNSGFVAATVESLRTHSCGLVVAWEPKGLQYVHLRKYMLASTDNPGLFFLVRNAFARRNASPAGLRMLLQQRQEDIAVEIFKQRGLAEPIILRFPLAAHLLTRPSTKHLGAERPKQVPARHKHGNVVRLSHRAQPADTALWSGE